jgi:hypothetical protein
VRSGRRRWLALQTPAENPAMELLTVFVINGLVVALAVVIH